MVCLKEIKCINSNPFNLLSGDLPAVTVAHLISCVFQSVRVCSCNMAKSVVFVRQMFMLFVNIFRVRFHCWQSMYSINSYC